MLKAKDLDCEMIKYGEVKALISGVTTIQGTSPGSQCIRTLIRNAENQSELGTSANHIRTYILDISSFTGTVNWTAIKSFVVHLAEGVRGDPKSVAEFASLKSKGLLAAGTAIIHGSCPGSGGKEKWRILPVGEVHDQRAALQGGHRRNTPWARVSASQSERMSVSPSR
jgi:5-methylthioadenosine/S-adenosylhomocysteine deaminase